MLDQSMKTYQQLGCSNRELNELGKYNKIKAGKKTGYIGLSIVLEKLHPMYKHNVVISMQSMFPNSHFNAHGSQNQNI